MGYASASIPWTVVLFLGFYVMKTVIYRLLEDQAMRRNGCEPPANYPHIDPFLGSDLHRIMAQSIARGNNFATRRDLFRKYGKTYRSNWFGQPNLNTMDVKNIQTVLALSPGSFVMSPLRNAIAEPFLGNGLLTRDGKVWQHARSTVVPIFARLQSADLESLELYLKQMITLIPKDGTTVNMMPLFKRLFIDKGTEFLFGQSVNSLSPEQAHPDIEMFLTVFEDTLRGLGARLRLGHLRFLRGRDHEWKGNCKEVHAVLERFIDQAAQRKQERTKASDGEQQRKYVLIDKLLEVTQDRAEIRTMLVNVFLAGRDQIGIAISHIFFILARHPHVWRKLREGVSDIKQPITHETLKSFKYLQYVLSESLRLHSPVGRSIRHCISDCVLPHGGGPEGKCPVFLRRGTQVEMDFSAMHHDPSIWGENSERFVPERWEGLRVGWEYIPFLGGGRVCPAKEMVLMQCGYVVVRMVQEFETLENRDEELKFVEDMRNVKQSRNGVLVGMTPSDIRT